MKNHCGHCGEGASQAARSDRIEVSGTRERAETRGIAWMIGAFVICPCHLPLTMALATSLLAGTAAGAALRGHPLAAGTAITLAWLAASWHGVRLLRKPAARWGMLAVGGLACGLFAVGGASIGLLLAVGGAAVGLGVSVGGFAVGSIAHVPMTFRGGPGSVNGRR